MASIKLTGDTSGEITISAPAVAGTNTLTLPANTGNIVTTGDSATVTQGMIGSGVAGTGPAFSAYVGSAQSLTGLAFTKMAISTEEFDTASCFDSTTNYRFTPTVAGYYQVNGQVAYSSVVDAPQLLIYKNGSIFKRGVNTGSGVWTTVSALIYLNGTTDYIELYGGHTTAGSVALSIGETYNYFQASLARAA